MSARDIYHDAVVRALQKEDWVITNDPLRVHFGNKRDALIDLGAERLVAAEKDGSRIAVEIKSFIRPSLLRDLEDAVGQFVLYRLALKRSPENSDRHLYLAIPDDTYRELEQEDITDILASLEELRLFTFDPDTEEIVQWIS